MKIGCGIVLIAVAAWSLPSHADDPFGLLGSDISAPQSRAQTEGPTPDIPDEVLEAIIEMPTRQGIEALLNARVLDITRRGRNEIDIYSRVAPSTVFITGEQTCAGIIVSSDGKILTCWHCVRDRHKVDVRLHPNTKKMSTLSARVVMRSKEKDLALLQLVEPVPGLQPLGLDNQEKIQVGADVYALGHPLGSNWTFVKGMVSKENGRQILYVDDNRHEAEVVQVQIELYPGNSGGPLVSDQGRLVGVNARKQPGMNFANAIALSEVRLFLGEAVEGRQESARLVQTSQKTSCARKELARGRNADNTGTVTLFDTNCDGKADVQLLILDGAADSFAIATSSDGSGKIDMVRVHHGGGVSIYLSGASKPRRQ